MIYMQNGSRYKAVPLTEQDRIAQMTYSELAAHDERNYNRFAAVIVTLVAAAALAILCMI